VIRSLKPADFLTLTNGACGTFAVFMCLNYLDTSRSQYLWAAFSAFPVALLLDFLDGYVARRSDNHSALGTELDSLADIISFGVAPAVVAYTLGMRGGWDVPILMVFVSCGIGRLARYNVTFGQFADATGKVTHYQGTPIPSTVILVAVMALAFSTGNVHDALWLGRVRLQGMDWHPLSLIFFASGCAMISSRLRIPKP
jgi:CDP-diacylglycerol---serine O-phosphatidyltransferase